MNKKPSIDIYISMITLFQHGYASSGKCFSKLFEFFKYDNIVIYSEIITARKFDKNHFIDFFKENRNKEIFIRTEFINCFDNNSNQVEELSIIIENIEQVANISKFNLVGHSKGGLVNLEYCLMNPNKIDKIISISTPYAANKFVDMINNIIDFANQKGLYRGNNQYIENFELLGDEVYLSKLRSKWNKEGEKNKLFIIAGVSSKIKRIGLSYDQNGIQRCNYIIKIYSDGVVELDDQLGIGKNNINNLIVNKQNIKVFDSIEKETILIDKNKSNNYLNLNNKSKKITSFLNSFGNLDDFFYDIKSLNDISKPYYHTKIVEQNDVAEYLQKLILND